MIRGSKIGVSEAKYKRSTWKSKGLMSRRFHHSESNPAKDIGGSFLDGSSYRDVVVHTKVCDGVGKCIQKGQKIIKGDIKLDSKHAKDGTGLRKNVDDDNAPIVVKGMVDETLKEKLQCSLIGEAI